jgi:hypothetical protein
VDAHKNSLHYLERLGELIVTFKTRKNKDATEATPHDIRLH